MTAFYCRACLDAMGMEPAGPAEPIQGFCQCCRVRGMLYALTGYRMKFETYTVRHQRNILKGGCRTGRPKRTGNRESPRSGSRPVEPIR